MTKYFQSARSKVLGGFIWGVLLAVLSISYYEVFTHYSFTNVILILLIFFVIFMLVGIVWFKTGYKITNEYLIIKIGPIIYLEIKLSSISAISRSNSILAAPANSLKRLSIKYGRNGLVLVSPKDEAGFLNTIIEKNPNLKLNL